MTQRWKLTIEYNGAGFAGWQRQSHALSVQQVLEEAIQRFSGEETRLHVAGRTDAGVHALGQVAHMDLERATSAREIMGALNYHIRPHAVSVLAVEPVSENFHARFDAKARSYRYVLLNRTAPPALEAGRVWHFPRQLALAPMQEGARLLLGHHDFSTFRAQGCQAKSPLKTLDRLDVRQQGSYFIFETKARSFLYHQVRNMVGTLTLLGTEAWTPQDLRQAFEAADRTKGGPTAPSDGLYFCAVDYDDAPSPAQP